MPIGHIVVPVDFSEKSEGAARCAAALRRRFGSPVTLLHVLPPPHYEFGAMEVGGGVIEDLYRNRSEQASEDLDGLLAEELAGDGVERVVVEGDPAATIVEVAHSHGSGLILMPTHGYGTFRRFILGSVTAKVLHDADCPVWTGVHMEGVYTRTRPFMHIVAAIDLGPQSERALMWAHRFAEMTGAELSLVHAAPDIEQRAGEYFDPDWRKHVENSIREETAALLSRLGMSAPLTIESGETAETVCNLSRAAEADILVIGRGSAAGVFGRLRANAYSIIRLSHCPVVSV
jgi:nucleotide-binding universal stress UspA family protein